MFNFNMNTPKPGTKLYEILGLTPSASETEIRKAYKKLSMKYHPDRPTGDAEKFKQINFAHDVLSDPEKKNVYDEAGEEGLEQMASGGGGPGIPEDLIDLIMPGMRRGRKQQGPKRSKDIGKEFFVILEELYTGVTKPFELKRTVKCKECKGIGTPDEKFRVECKKCNGKGKQVHIRQMGPMIQQHVVDCRDCNGTGKTIVEGKECKKCHGSRTIEEDYKTDVTVRPGSKNGEHICLKGKAHEDPDCAETGDLVLILKEISSQTELVRKDNDLIYVKEIDLVNALCGVNFYIKHLDGRYLNIKYDDIISSDQTLMVEDEGMPITDSTQNGDLYVKFKVKFPLELDESRKTYLKKILPKSPNIGTEFKPPKDADIEEKILEAIDESNMNDEDDGQPPFMMGGDDGNVECHQQ